MRDELITTYRNSRFPFGDVDFIWMDIGFYPIYISILVIVVIIIPIISMVIIAISSAIILDMSITTLPCWIAIVVVVCSIYSGYIVAIIVFVDDICLFVLIPYLLYIWKIILTLW